MNWQDYTVEMRRTVSADTSLADRLAIARLGIAGETGELIDAIKKIVYQEHPIDRNAIRSELGDIYWYIALLMDVCGLSCEDLYHPRRLLYETATNDNANMVRLVLSLSEHVGNLQKQIRLRRSGHRDWRDGWYYFEALGRVTDDLARLQAIFGVTLDEVICANVAKLRARYPDGFDAQRSIHRAESGSGDSAESEAQG